MSVQLFRRARCGHRPNRGHSIAGHRFITIVRPADRTRSAAASSITPSWNHTARAFVDKAWSAISPARRELTKTSTTSTSNGMSASVG